MTADALLPGLLEGGPVLWRCDKCTQTITTILPLTATPLCRHQGRGRPAPMRGTRLSEVPGPGDPA